MIKKLVKGEAPSLLDTEKGNELIKAINALQNMTIVPADAGRVNVGENNVVFELTPGGGGGDLPVPPASGNYYLASIDGAIQWVANTTVPVVLAVLQGDGTLKARVVEVCGTDVGDYPVP